MAETMRLLGISGLAGSGKDTFASYLRLLGATNVALADPLKQIAKAVYDFTDEQLWGPSAERNKPDPRYPRNHTFHGNDLVCACCGWDGGSLVRDGSSPPPCYLTPRYVLQLLGTDWGRECYPDTWVEKCVRTARQLLTNHRARYSFKTGLYTVPESRDWDSENEVEAGRVKLVTVSDVRFRNEVLTIQKAGGKVVRVKRPGAGLGGAAGLHPSEAEQMAIPDRAFDFVVENDGTLGDLQTRALAIGKGLLAG